MPPKTCGTDTKICINKNFKHTQQLHSHSHTVLELKASITDLCLLRNVSDTSGCHHRFYKNFFTIHLFPSAQHPHFLSEDTVPWTGWELLLLNINWGESRRGSSVMFMPLRASSSRAMRMKAASTFWASLAEVSKAASTLLFSARVQASSNNTCLWAWRSDLLPAVEQVLMYKSKTEHLTSNTGQI